MLAVQCCKKQFLWNQQWRMAVHNTSRFLEVATKAGIEIQDEEEQKQTEEH